MGYVIPAGYSRVSVNFSGISTLGSAPSFGFGVDSNPDVGMLTDLVGWLQDSLLPITWAGTSVTSMTMRNDFQTYDQVVDLPGNVGGNFQSPNVAALVKLSTGLTGRANRGRMYLPYVIEDNEIDSAGVLGTLALSKCQQAIDELLALLATTDNSLVILHSVEGVPSPVLAAAVQRVAATQRRRLRR